MKIEEWAIKLDPKDPPQVFVVKKIMVPYTYERYQELAADMDLILCRGDIDEARSIIAMGDGFMIELYPG